MLFVVAYQATQDNLLQNAGTARRQCCKDEVDSKKIAQASLRET
jgi:hypothetical protein